MKTHRAKTRIAFFCIAAVVPLLFMQEAARGQEPEAEPRAAYWYGKGAQQRLWSIPQNWSQGRIPLTDGTTEVFIIEGGGDSEIDAERPWPVATVVFKQSADSFSLTGQGLAFQIEGAARTLFLGNSGDGIRDIDIPVFVSGTGEPAAAMVGGGEMVFRKPIEISGSVASLTLLNHPSQKITMEGPLIDKTDMGFNVIATTGELFLSNAESDFRGDLIVGSAGPTVVSCSGVAAAGQASPTGAGTKIVFGTGHAAGDATFTLNYSGEGPASTDREINIVGSLEEDRTTRAKISVEKTGAQLTLLGNVGKDRYKGPCDLVLAGAGHGVLKGRVFDSIRSLVMEGSGRWEVTSPDNTFAGNALVEGGTLGIVGSVAGDVQVAKGGTLAPLGPLSIAGSLRGSEGATLLVAANSAPVEVNGSLDLQSAQMAFGETIDPALRPGQTVVLVRYGTLASGAAFRDLPEGAEVKLGSRMATISYGNSNNPTITLKVTR